MCFKEVLGFASKIMSSRPARGTLGSPVRWMSSAEKSEWIVKCLRQLAQRSGTENSLYSELTNDVTSCFFGGINADNSRPGRALDGKDHLDKTSRPCKAPVLYDPARLLNFVCLRTRVKVEQKFNERVNGTFEVGGEVAP